MVEPEIVMLVTKIPCNSITKKQSELLNVRVNYTYRGPATRGRLGAVVTQKTILTEFDEIGSTRKEVYVDLPASDTPAPLYTDITGMPLSGCEPKAGYGMKVYALDLDGKPEWGCLDVLTVAAAPEMETLEVKINPAGAGYVTTDPEPSGGTQHNWLFPHGTVVYVTAHPNPGYTFKSWSGEMKDTTAVTAPVYPMTEKRTITAHFESAPPVKEAPVINTLPAINITHDSATLKTTLARAGYCAVIMCYLEWGTTIGYGYKSPERRLYPGEELAVDIAGLSPNTTYHFRAVAVGRCVTPPLTGYGSDMTFTTAAEVVKGFTMRVINPPAGATHWMAGAVLGGALPYMRDPLPIYQTWAWDKDVPDYAINFALMILDAEWHSLHSMEWDLLRLRDGKNYVYNCATWQMTEA